MYELLDDESKRTGYKRNRTRFLLRTLFAPLCGQRVALTTGLTSTFLLRTLFAPLCGGFTGGMLLYVFLVKVLWTWRMTPYAVATFGPPLLLLTFLAGTFIQVGLLGHCLGEDEREWWARLSANTLMYAAGWLTLFVTVVYAPWAIATLLPGVWGRVIQGGLLTGWVWTTIKGVLAGLSPHTPQDEKKRPNGELLTVVAPPVFVAGLLTLVAVAIGSQIDEYPVGEPFLTTTPGRYWVRVLDSSPAWNFGLLAINLGLIAAFMLTIDVNLFSLHAMYANRLTRCYLGASRPKAEWQRRWRRNAQGHFEWGPGTGGAPTNSRERNRQQNRVTGFDPDDDMPLSDLHIGKTVTVKTKRGDGTESYYGPFPLYNTSLNLIAGKDLAWKDRKAESFTLTPLYCGSTSTGYQEILSTSRENLTLGRAMAISGAAADANMGYHHSAALTALMTVFNARLGWWIENPDRTHWRGRDPDGTAMPWRAQSPNFGYLLVKEFLGRTDAKGDYVHLSDGGHFENMGVYELVRRRCRFIVCCDAGTDLTDASENLANLIRLVRTDFGIRLKIDTTPLRVSGEDRLSRWHVAIGSIHYEDIDYKAETGMLVFIRATMTGDEPSDVRNYQKANPEFPHQSTVDQFFDEPQFESYRALGQHVATRVFEPVKSLGLMVSDLPSREIFSALKEAWFPAPPDLLVNYQQSARNFFQIQGMIRTDPNLGRFSAELYPELEAVAKRSEEQLDKEKLAELRRAELHVVSQIVEAMEEAWLGVKLEGYPEHPMNRGWLNVFRRVADTPTFHTFWPVVRGGLNQEFIRFVERELKVPSGVPTPEPYEKAVADPTVKASFDQLCKEYAREWPEEMLRGRELKALVEGANRTWLIRSVFRPDEADTQGVDKFVLGVMIVRPLGRSSFAAGNDCDKVWEELAKKLEKESQTYELFVYVRGAYRHLGIAPGGGDIRPIRPLEAGADAQLSAGERRRQRRRGRDAHGPLRPLPAVEARQHGGDGPIHPLACIPQRP